MMAWLRGNTRCPAPAAPAKANGSLPAGYPLRHKRAPKYRQPQILISDLTTLTT